MPEKDEVVKKSNSQFLPVEEEKEAMLLIKEGATHLSPTMVWTKNQEKVITTTLSAFSPSEKTLYVLTPRDQNPALFMDELAKLGERELYFSVSTPRANIFFKAEFAGFDDAGLKFRHPKKVYKVQRRKDFRMRIPDGHVIKLQLTDPLDERATLNKKIYDLSASGLSFIVTEEEEALFSEELILQNLTFTVKARTFQTHAEVRHKRAMPEESRHKGYKVGVLFKGLSSLESQFLAQYVFEESRKFFSRYI